MASLNCSSDSKDATQRVFAMNALYLLITIFCSFSLNSCQTYVFSDEMCRKNSNVLGISIATNTEFSESSEIVVITDRDLLYWSNSTSDHQWLKEALPWNWSASSVVIFRRNFIEELTECGKSISDFFVVKFNPITGVHEYDIYQPRLATKWRYFGRNQSARSLSDHYMIGQYWSKSLTSGLSLYDHLILFEGSRYHIIRINQSHCDHSTDLSSTFGYLANSSLSYEPVFSFFWRRELNFVTRNDNLYSINHMTANLDQIQNGTIDSSGERTDPLLGYLIECRNTSVSNVISSNETTVPQKEDKDSTERKDSDDQQTSGPPPDSDNMLVLMTILFVSLVVSAIICIISCCSFCDSTHRRIKDEKKISKSRDKRKRKLLEKKILKTSENTMNKPNDQQKDRQRRSGISKEKPKPKESEDRKSNESIVSSQSPTSLMIFYSNAKSDAKIDDKPIFSQENVVRHQIQIEVLAPDEGKPSNPFDGFPESL